MGKIYITKDETETFTRSTCNCSFCMSMHDSVNEWSTFVPETKLQRNMMNVVAKIENRYKKNLLRRSERLQKQNSSN